MNQAPKFSVVVPAYNERESLTELIDRTVEVFKTGFVTKQDFEIIIVDDGSIDGTSEYLLNESTKRDYLRPVIMRRNVGKSLAMSAGFMSIRGDIVVMLDADLQDRPEDIPALVEKLNEGYELVGGFRGRERNDTIIRKLGSKIFNFAVRKASGLKLQDMNCGFKVCRAEVVKNICVYGQFHRYLPLIAYFAGYNVAEVPVQNDSRKYGSSKFPTFRYQGLFDLLSLLFLHRYNFSPLHFFANVAAIFLIPSSLILTFFIGRHILWLMGFSDSLMISMRPLLSISLTAFLVGLVILLTGFMCDFILYHTIKGRMKDMVDLYIKEKAD